ncbi:ABC transporter substrate-binding protein [uncultured Corynebacterium sp.]|uniref:ABC transporter substrate-binding protein n=1 Tax=uncultured Corynebacterium sp. TaxID=159447 RepID=UPI0025F36585|nr:ABC transporter substrate-binding protein [uncultured Corynebacterium sp.]
MTLLFHLSRIARTALTAGTTLALSIGLAACSSGDSGGDSSASATDSASTLMPAGEGTTSYPARVETPLGTAELTERPEKIVTYGGVTTELALSLGITPSAANDWSSTRSFLADYGAEQIGTILEPTDGQVPVEAIAALDPDLIIYSGGQDADKTYTQLAAIAPTMGYGAASTDKGRPWSDQLADLGTATDLQDAADTVQQDRDDVLATVREEHPEYTGHTATFISDKGGSIYFETYGGGPGESFFTDLGFDTLPSAGRYSANTKLSEENIADVEADVIFVYDPSDGIPTLKANQTFTAFPAYKEGRVFALPAGHQKDGEEQTDEEKLGTTMAVGLSSPAPLTEQWIAEQVVDQIGDSLK